MKNFTHLLTFFIVFKCFNLCSQPTIPTSPPSPSCPSGVELTTNSNVNVGETYFFNRNNSLSNINLNGGTIVICGNLTINSGNLNTGNIFVLNGSSLIINNSVSTININLINYGFVDLRANNMSFNTSSNIWNYGDSLIISGNGTHNMNGLLLTGSNSSTRIESNVIINGNGLITIEDNSIMYVEGYLSNNGNVMIGNISTLQISGTYSSNNGSNVFIADYSLIEILGQSIINTNFEYIGNQMNGSIIHLIGSTNINNPISPDNLIFVCTNHPITTTQLGSAQLSCSNIDNFGFLSSIILPVKFRNIYITKNENILTIVWSTYLEINNSHFSIESSDDMIVWYVVDYVLGNGTTNNINNYKVYDYNPKKYYRILQYDFDGKMIYYGPFSLNKLLSLIKVFHIDIFGKKIYDTENYHNQLIVEIEENEGKFKIKKIIQY